MADAEKKTLEKLKRLYDTLRELQAKSSDVTEEIGRLLNGEAGIGDGLKGLEQALSATWAARHKTPYIWQYVKDRPNLKRLWKLLGGPAPITARWLNYVRDDDPYLVKARHPFALFVANVNRYADSGESSELELVEAPADCRHTPPCHSDQEHTRKRSAELRA
jgi:hypothetical protein